MKLKQLIKPGLQIRGNSSIEITGLTSDSRKVTPGNLFFARKGAKFDGTAFISQAIQAGAAAVVTDLYDPFCPVPQVIASNVAAAEAPLAAVFYDHPSRQLFTVGITGSKGKTTTTYLVRHLLEGLGLPCGLMTTVEVVTPLRRFSSSHTTYDAITNQKWLKEMVTQGCKAAALEVSSHGLDQGRVDEVAFAFGICTNLYPDHLDYHKTVENYAAAKRLLIQRASERVLLNADNPWTPFMREKAKAPIWTFGLDEPADLSIKDGKLTFQNKSHILHTRLLGRFNLSNLLAAAAVGLHRGASLEQIAEILSRFEAVPGRLEEIFHPKPFRVFVDYAHTGEALFHVLKTLREQKPKRLIVVFGCGGNRDPARRTEMAKAADELADVVVITSDNPRNEDPAEIARQSTDVLKRPYQLELDRKKAIELALAQAQEGDLVLIAGKGHEKEQIFAHQTMPFDDVEVARRYLRCD